MVFLKKYGKSDDLPYFFINFAADYEYTEHR